MKSVLRGERGSSLPRPRRTFRTCRGPEVRSNRTTKRETPLQVRRRPETEPELEQPFVASQYTSSVQSDRTAMHCLMSTSECWVSKGVNVISRMRRLVAVQAVHFEIRRRRLVWISAVEIGPGPAVTPGACCLDGGSCFP